MTRGGNNFLFHQHFLTYAAVLSFFFTVLGTGSCNCCIRYLLVTRCWDALPLLHGLTTVLAFCFLCPSVLGTSCGLFQFTSINIQMSAGRYRLLRFQHLIAVIAVAALGQTVFGTGCRFAFVSDRKMICLCVWYLHCEGRRITSAAQCNSVLWCIGYFLIQLTGRFCRNFVCDTISCLFNRFSAVYALSRSRHTCHVFAICIVPGPAHFIRHIVGRSSIFMPAGRTSRRFRASSRHRHIAGHITTVGLIFAVAAFVYTAVPSIVPVFARHIDVCTVTVRTFCHRTIFAKRRHRYQQHSQ